MQGWQSYVGIEGFKRNLHEIEEKHGWINNACIMALADNGESEIAIHYQEYHDKLKREREEDSRRQHEEYDRQEQERQKKHQEEIVAQLDQAEQNIRDKKDPYG